MMSVKQAEQSEPGSHRGMAPRDQALAAFQPKAGIARAVVVFDPR
jgi:hypothetical protein